MYRPLAALTPKATLLSSLGSISLPTWLKSLAPRPITFVNWLVVRSSTAMALASCRVTKARVPSWVTAMYSGSKSIPVFVRRLLPSVGTPANPAVATTVRVSMSMMLTLPAGSNAV